jgi:uncharacterized protein (TIGR03435 family)
MMWKLERFLYRLIVRMHPAPFRHEFGREMLLDFEDAVGHLGVIRVSLDALLSVARQWARCATSAGADRTCGAQPSLLAGRYVPVRDEPLNAVEWGRGLLASAAVIGFIGYSLVFGSPVPSNSGAVYAAMQMVAAGQSPPSETKQDSGPASDKPHREFKEFDVVSVRENKTGTVHISFPIGMDDYYVPTHGYMQIIGLTLGAYIQIAYKMDPKDVVALGKQMPDWALSARYDIEARVEGEPDKNDMRTMMRALLADRFKLQLHTETRVDRVYDLVLAKAGKTAPALHEHPSNDPGCKQDSPQGFFNPCGTIAQMTSAPNMQRMVGRNVSVAQFIYSSSPKVDRTIVDKTGLTGKYDFTLEFAPERIGSGPDTNASEPPPSPTFPEAIRDQMGLKLVPNKGPVTTYVLDHVEKPAEN